MARFIDWTPDDSPGHCIAVPDGWAELRSYYSPRRANKPLDRVIELARDHAVRTVVVEYRYIDLDYRSEHSRFYSTTFQRYPSVCHRLHFFRDEIPEVPLGLGPFDPDSYVGYSVMRPIPNAPVGRTVILPPRELSTGSVALAEDRVHLWGNELIARGVPFVSQDAQYMRCAHSALWMMLYHASLVHGTPRRLPSDIQTAATGGNVLGREIPSEGLSVAQVLKALHELNMAGPRLKLPATEEASNADHRLSLIGVMSRYVNSQMPPMVYSKDHAWVVVGYIRGADDQVTLYRHDDARGPYLRIDDPWNEPDSAHSLWKGAIPPLPQKMYMTSERAELVGETRLRRRLAKLPENHPLRTEYGSRGEHLTVRTYGISSARYLERVAERYPPELAVLYRLQHWSRWIWVVELVDRRLLYDGKACVLGEAIIDATASDLSTISDPVLIVRRLWDEAVVYSPDYEETRKYTVPANEVGVFRSGSEVLRGWEYPYE